MVMRGAVIEKLFTSGAGWFEGCSSCCSSPTSPLDLKLVMSPRRVVLQISSCDEVVSGRGIGLGIIVNMNKSRESKAILLRQSHHVNANIDDGDEEGEKAFCSIEYRSIEIAQMEKEESMKKKMIKRNKHDCGSSTSYAPQQVPVSRSSGHDHGQMILKALDEGYSNKNYVRKFLRALHPKWIAKVTTIEELKDLTSLSLDELIGNLKVHKMTIKKDSEIVKEKVEKKSVALKAKKESSDEECSTSESEDEDTPWQCGDPNHLVRECPKPLKDKNQRAFVEGSWSDSGEEDDEKVYNETCLVAQASSEICLGVDLEPDEWIKDNGCSKHLRGDRKLFSRYKAYNGDENGIVSRNKVRLVAQGYNQQEGIDYDETYAPISRLESIRILLAYACALDFKLFQMDVKSAFLNGFINEECLLEIKDQICPRLILEFYSQYQLNYSDQGQMFMEFVIQNQFFSYSLEEFVQILDIPCEGVCVFTDKWSLDELAYGVPTDGPYQTNPPSPDDIILSIRIDREGQVRRNCHEEEIDVLDIKFFHS
ncbi:copia protein [Tanacetum coccineum]